MNYRLNEIKTVTAKIGEVHSDTLINLYILAY